MMRKKKEREGVRGGKREGGVEKGGEGRHWDVGFFTRKSVL